jgi:hypothetical protein
MYYGYRWYDPETGRWPSRDPIGEEGGVNLYNFIINDAVNGIDVYGLRRYPRNNSTGPTPFTSPPRQPNSGRSVTFFTYDGRPGTSPYVPPRRLPEITRPPRPRPQKQPPANPTRNEILCPPSGLRKCLPCFPSVGEIGWLRVDLTGDAHFNKWNVVKGHGPFPIGYISTPHIHISKVNQTPYPDCKCRWNKLDFVLAGSDTGSMPDANIPVRGGGPI